MHFVWPIFFNSENVSGKVRGHKRLLYDKRPIENATSSFSVLSFFLALTSKFVKSLMKKLPFLRGYSKLFQSSIIGTTA